MKAVFVILGMVGLSGCMAPSEAMRVGRETGARVGATLDKVLSAAAEDVGTFSAGYARGYQSASGGYCSGLGSRPAPVSATLIGGGHTTFINGDSQSGTIITPGEGTSFYNLDARGNGTIITPGVGTTFISQ